MDSCHFSSVPHILDADPSWCVQHGSSCIYMTKHYQKIEKEVDERTFTSISQLLTSLRRLNPRGHRLFSDPRRENRNDKTTTFILIGLWITALQPQVLSRSKISFFVLGILKPYHVISLSLSLARRYMREYLEVNADSMYCFFC